jgi:putative molybdopterin biosynthesis protein
MEQQVALTTQEVAEILKIAKNTVYELIKRGELRSYKVGRKVRIDMKDVEEYISRGKNTTFANENKLFTSPLKGELVLPPAPAPSNKLNDYNLNNYNLNNQNSIYNSCSDRNFVICGQDLLLDILTRHLAHHQNGITSLRSYTGSYNGLVDLYRGKADVATAHLWDGETGQYNVPYVRRIIPGIPCVIVHLVCRMQGFYVAKGNPKEINSWEDLTRPEVLMINRECGCGTRILLDEHLRKLKIDSSLINGYEKEDFSHLAVASTVARGEADVAIGNEKPALQVQDIDFIPIQKERYELVIKKQNLSRYPFNIILDILNSKEFQAELLGIGGYDLTEMGKIIAET